MKKIAIVYWSGTGNTKAMASHIQSTLQTLNADVSVFLPDEFSSKMIGSFDAIAFGCPSMGAEVLEEYEFEPMFNACKAHLKDKRITLFGSYGWGDGEWMRDWEKDCIAQGAILTFNPVIVNEEPDEDDLLSCEKLAKSLI